MLHTHYANAVARWMIERNRIPGIEGFSIVKPEVTIGRSRFDFLLQKDNCELVLEVKTCTMFGKDIAMFPDAVTERGRRHITELAELHRSGKAAGILILINWPHAGNFIPDYHTDFDFSRTLLELKDDLLIKPVTLSWSKDLQPSQEVKEVKIPWWLIEGEAHDRGSYIIILRLGRRRRIQIGSLGKVLFQKGYYLYVGSAERNLTKRIERHRRKRKNRFWHIDYLREHADVHAVLPVRSSTRLECPMASSIEKIADWTIRGFGSSDCSCDTHLFGMKGDPIHDSRFIEMLLYYRIDRLSELLDSNI
jgi:sugar fermentation stimulation protein A